VRQYSNKEVEAVVHKSPSVSAPVPQQPSRLQRLLDRLMHFRFRRNLAFLTMALPAILHLFVFAYLPLVGIIVAFKRYRIRDGIFGSEWVGLKNFEFLLGTNQIWTVVRNTLALNLLFIITGTVLSIFIALLIYEIYTSVLVRFYQTTLFFPGFISWVVVTYFVFALLSSDYGLINNLLKSFGFDPITWYSEPQYWPWILLLVSLWKSAGGGSLLYLAGLLGIDPQYYEAARIDGANRWQEFRYITLPLLTPVIVVQLLIAIGYIFNSDFGMFFLVPRDEAALYSTTNVLDTFLYRALRDLGNVGMASAAGLAKSIMGFVLVVLANWLVRRWDAEKSLF
jgi:putative aldouronate transport system permease protein